MDTSSNAKVYSQGHLESAERQAHLLEQQIEKLQEQLENDLQRNAETRALTICFGETPQWNEFDKVPGLPESDRVRIHRALNRARKQGAKPSLRRQTSYNSHDFLDSDAYVDFELNSEQPGWELKAKHVGQLITDCLKAEGLSVVWDESYWSAITIEPSVVFVSYSAKSWGSDELVAKPIKKDRY